MEKKQTKNVVTGLELFQRQQLYLESLSTLYLSTERRTEGMTLHLTYTNFIFLKPKLMQLLQTEQFESTKTNCNEVCGDPRSYPSACFSMTFLFFARFVMADTGFWLLKAMLIV